MNYVRIVLICIVSTFLVYALELLTWYDKVVVREMQFGERHFLFQAISFPCLFLGMAAYLALTHGRPLTRKRVIVAGWLIGHESAVIANIFKYLFLPEGMDWGGLPGTFLVTNCTIGPLLGWVPGLLMGVICYILLRRFSPNREVSSRT